MQNNIRAQLWDTIDSIPVPTQIIRHGPLRADVAIRQCQCDLEFLKSNANELIIGTDKIVSRNISPQYFDEMIYPTDTIFNVNPTPKC